MACCDTRTVNFKLMVGVLEWRAITGSDIAKAWEKVGLWPMDYRFARKWKNENGNCPAPRGEDQSRLDDSAVLMEIEQQVQAARSGEKSPSRAIQQISITLKQQETVNSILMSAGLRSSLKSIGAGNCSAAPAKRVELPQSRAGCLAIFFTTSEQLDALRKSDNARKKAKQKKNEERALRAKKKEQRAKWKEESAKLKKARATTREAKNTLGEKRKVQVRYPSSKN